MKILPSSAVQAPTGQIVRILHITSGLGDGGAEGVLFRLCAENLHRDQAVISLTSEGKYGPLLKEKGLEVTALGMQRWWAAIPGFWKLMRAILVLRPDVVQTWMPPADLIGGLAARFCGIKNTFWSIRATDYGTGFSTIRTKLIVWALSKTARFIPRKIVSCAEAAMFSHVLLGYPADKIVVIPNGYGPEPHAKSISTRVEYSQRFGIAPEIKILGMVARYHPQKDHRSLFTALKLLSETRGDFICFLAGTGMDSSNHELVRAIESAGISQYVILLGPLAQPRDFMAGLDLHVLSSSFGEGFPNVIAESMGLGVPNVSTDVGDAKKIIGDIGWIVKPRNPAELATAIAGALSLTSDELEEIGASSRQRINTHFSDKKMFDSYYLLYTSRTLLQVTRYGNLGASSRVRFDQYSSSLAAANFSIIRDSFFPDDYVRARYSNFFPVFLVLVSYVRRLTLFGKMRRAEIIWIEKEIFPWMPWFLEKLFIPWRRKVVTDYDDAVYLAYESHKSVIVRKILGSKIRNLMARSDLVLVGNDVIGKYARDSGAKRVQHFPTVIDVERYQNVAAASAHKPPGSRTVIGWIGTPITWQEFMVDKVPLLRRVARHYGVEFWAIGANVTPALLAEGWIRFFPWTEETELAILADIDIGIMPLDDSPWASGKCGYKLLQHMGMATAVVASPVGVNRVIISHQENGFLANSDAEWTESLARLIDDPAMRQRMGARALSRVTEFYGLAEHATNLTQYFDEL